MKHPVYKSHMSGGVWRIKWSPHTYQTILAACMHGGFNAVDCEGALKASKEPEVLATYTEHESIAYGADWSHLMLDSIKSLCLGSDLSVREDLIPELESEDLLLISTCSFYDHKLCISLFSKPLSC